MAVLLKTNCRFSGILTKIPTLFFTEIERILKFTCKCRKRQRVKAILYEDGATSIMPDPKPFYSDIVIEAVWYWNKNRHTAQWKRVETPRYKVTQLQPSNF